MATSQRSKRRYVHVRDCRDAGFNNLVLEKPGQENPSYTLTNLEKLNSSKSNVPYFWRVKAIDLASNDGDWSQTDSFYVSSQPDWVKYTLIGLGGAAAAVLIFWSGAIFGRRH